MVSVLVVVFFFFEWQFVVSRRESSSSSSQARRCLELVVAIVIYRLAVLHPDRWRVVANVVEWGWGRISQILFDLCYPPEQHSDRYTQDDEADKQADALVYQIGRLVFYRPNRGGGRGLERVSG